MVSKARKSFDDNAKDIQRLLEIHINEGGDEKGRRYQLEVLNKSAIVLLTAFWEAYCEDIAAEALLNIITNATSSENLPTELKRIVAKKIKTDTHELAVWSLSGEGWRTYLQNRFEEMTEDRNKKLNTPKTLQIEALFRETIGIEKISESWKWQKMSVSDAKNKLDEMVSLRGAVAHRGNHSSSITKQNVEDYFGFIKKLTGKTGGRVNTYIKSITGVPLWE